MHFIQIKSECKHTHINTLLSKDNEVIKTMTDF